MLLLQRLDGDDVGPEAVCTYFLKGATFAVMKIGGVIAACLAIGSISCKNKDPCEKACAHAAAVASVVEGQCVAECKREVYPPQTLDCISRAKDHQSYQDCLPLTKEQRQLIAEYLESADDLPTAEPTGSATPRLPSAKSIRLGRPRVSGPLSTGVVDITVRNAVVPLETCGQARPRQRTQKMMIQFVINQAGRAERIEALDAEDAELARCVTGVIAGLSFQKPTGANASVNVPIAFLPPTAR